MESNINDISWYSDHPELLMDACSVSWFNPLGSKIHLAKGAVTPGVDVAQAAPTVPGIMAFDVTPIPGWASTPSDPVNVAMDNIYAWVRHVNSGSKVYDPADYMMYILGVGFAYAWIGWLRRVYSELMVTSMQNRYMPEACVVSEGVSFADLQTKVTAFREYINLSQVKLGVLAFPAEIKLVNRWIHLFSNVFADSPNAKAQIYKFRPAGYYQYVETEGPGYLEWHAFAENRKLTFRDIMIATDSMISALVKSEDIGVMSGDTIKAFGLDKLFNMEALTPEHFVLPIYNPEMLDQIQNMSITNSDVVGRDGSFMIEQKVDDLKGGNYLLCQPYVHNEANELAPYAWHTAKIFNVENEDVTPPQTMILSRLATGSTAVKLESVDLVALNVVGSEIVNRGSIYYLTDEGIPASVAMFAQYTMIGEGDFAVRRWMMTNSFRRAFDRGPTSLTFKDWGGGFVTLVDVNLDFSNYTTVECEVVGRMHTAAVMSLLNVPIVGTWGNKLK
jgi:hypothetical protein